ncbi:MAG: KH domain-containing protein [Parcubacteria group bacterium]|jgi:ribosomal RNA assembly protein
MKEFHIENPLIKRTRKKLEKLLNVKMTISNDELIIEGNGDDEYFAEKMIDALNLGFPLSIAELIRKEDFHFEILNIRDYSRKKDLKTVRARIIGTKGKALRTLCELTGCFFEIKDNCVGIIGAPESIKNAQDAIESIARGAKHANVYAFLEKHRIPPVLDLGLKEEKKAQENL